MDPSTQECQFYQTTLRGSYVGTTNNFGDVIDFLQRTVDSQTLVESLNAQQQQQDDQSSNSTNTATTITTTAFVTKFMGVPQSDIDESIFGSGTDQGREHLGEPTNLEDYQTSPSSNSQDRTTITIVGGLLVAAFSIVFISVLVILWRRRQAYLHSNSTSLVRHVQLSNDNNLDKLSVVGEGGGGGGNGTGGYPGSDPDLEPYNTSNTDEDEEEVEQGGGHPYNNNNYYTKSDSRKHHPDTSRDSSLYISKDDDAPPMNGIVNGEEDDDDLPSPTEDGQSETMQFDLGNSFKDQLLGLHGFSGHGPSFQSNSGTVNKRGGLLMSNVLFRQSGQSLDGDSDADSWAQTDGTIGSLELQLEPITAEV
jgi:hypothetical protein